MPKLLVTYGTHGWDVYSLMQSIWLYHGCLCEIDNNWALLLFTSCTLLTLFVDLVGSMGTGEAYPSQTWRYS